MFVIDLGLFGMICSRFVWLVRKIVLDSSSEFSDSSPGLCLLWCVLSLMVVLVVSLVSFVVCLLCFSCFDCGDC